MMVSMEAYLRRGQRGLERLWLDPRIRSAATAVLCWSGGFFLSAAGLMGHCLPLAVGLIAALTRWQATAAALGAMVGYPVFWGLAGFRGMIWSAAGGTLAVLQSDRQLRRDQPYMLPAIAAFLTASTSLCLRLILKDDTPILICFLEVGAALLSAMLFAQALQYRDAVTDWLVGGTVVFALAKVAPVPYLNLGCIAGGLMAVAGAFPGAALAGLGLDLARITPVPMTAVMSLSYLIRLLPFDKRWKRHAAPGISYAAVMVLCGIRDPTPIPGLVLGGMAGLLLPPRPELNHRRGETGPAQVRLELGAEVMFSTGRLISQMEPPPIDQAALLEKVRLRACGNCSARRGCAMQDCLSPELLQSPLEANCRKPGRLIPELRRAQDQLRVLTAQHRRQAEYRGALAQQYRFLGEYLRSLSDKLPRRGHTPESAYRVEVSARSRSHGRGNGDRCLAFAGPGRSYFVLLCDGMGTGTGAAQEGREAGRSLRQLLLAGFPPEHALRTYNSLLALGSAAGAVTLDLAELRLDTGLVNLYKWGAAPSWVLTRKGAQKIGTATPPPGISATEIRETVEKLSLRRGEVLVLLSDGVDGEEALTEAELTPDRPPGELAAKILEIGGGEEDDATAAVIRLSPTNLGTS